MMKWFVLLCMLYSTATLVDRPTYSETLVSRGHEHDRMTVSNRMTMKTVRAVYHEKHYGVNSSLTYSRQRTRNHIRSIAFVTYMFANPLGIGTNMALIRSHWSTWSNHAAVAHACTNERCRIEMDTMAMNGHNADVVVFTQTTMRATHILSIMGYVWILTILT